MTSHAEWNELCRKLYELHGENYSHAAEAAGLAPSYLWNQLHGKGSKNPRREIIRKVLLALSEFDETGTRVREPDPVYGKPSERIRSLMVWLMDQPQQTQESFFMLAKGGGWTEPIPKPPASTASIPYPQGSE